MYTLIQEMNAKWHKLNRDIESGQRRATRAATMIDIPILDEFTRASYGNLTVDGNGMLSAMWLDSATVAESRDDDVLAAIVHAIGSSMTAQIDSSISEYEV
ncbi:hypothetical protein [Nocardia lasii]|uniref:YbaB/EbfC family DNA-binding protein n=1 Tax=Nocardia lasii TaxID=1616107 RepID=A0ABW1JRM2_9NOCA